MLKPESRLRPNHDKVAAKVMDGEAILINLTSAVYYSLDKVGGFVWTRIEKGHRLDEIARATARSYDVTFEHALTDLQVLANNLLDESLVVLDGEGGGSSDDEISDPGATRRYQTPELCIYHDMLDLLALDPPAPGMENLVWKDPAEGSS